MKGDGERGSRGGELGRVEASSAPGRGGRIGPALGDPAQAVPGPAGGSVPGHGGLRPGVSPRRDRGGPARLRGVRGALGAGRTARRRRHLPPVPPVVRAASDRAGLCGGQAGLLCPAAGRRPRRAGGAGRAGRGQRDRVHARVRPAVLSGDPPAQGAAGDRAGPAAAGPGTFAALRVRPLRRAGPDHPDRPGAAADRPGELPARLVRVRLPVAARGRAGRAVPRHPADGRGRPGVGLRELRGPIRPGRDGPDLVRPVSAGVLGRREPVPAAAGLPGLRRARGRLRWRCPSGSSGPAPAGSRTSGSRWSRRSATCSTTSSIAWSAGTLPGADDPRRTDHRPAGPRPAPQSGRRGSRRPVQHSRSTRMREGARPIGPRSTEAHRTRTAASRRTARARAGRAGGRRRAWA